MPCPTISGRLKPILMGAFGGFIFAIGIYALEALRIHAPIEFLTPVVSFLVSFFLLVALKLPSSLFLFHLLFFAYWIFMGAVFGWLVGIPSSTLRWLGIIMFAGLLIGIHLTGEKKFEEKVGSFVKEMLYYIPKADGVRPNP